MVRDGISSSSWNRGGEDGHVAVVFSASLLHAVRGPCLRHSTG